MTQLSFINKYFGQFSRKLKFPLKYREKKRYDAAEVENFFRLLREKFAINCSKRANLSTIDFHFLQFYPDSFNDSCKMSSLFRGFSKHSTALERFNFLRNVSIDFSMRCGIFHFFPQWFKATQSSTSIGGGSSPEYT